MDKLDALGEFARFGDNRFEAISVITSTPDIQDDVYILTQEVFCQVLQRAINGEIDIDELELWANVLESRQDIDESAVEGAIYALSNNEQMGELSKSTLKKLLDVMKQLLLALSLFSLRHLLVAIYGSLNRFQLRFSNLRSPPHVGELRQVEYP